MGVLQRLQKWSGKLQKAAKKPLWSPFVKKNFTEFLLDLKKWSAFFLSSPNDLGKVQKNNTLLIIKHLQKEPWFLYFSEKLRIIPPVPYPSLPAEATECMIWDCNWANQVEENLPY